MYGAWIKISIPFKYGRNPTYFLQRVGKSNTCDRDIVTFGNTIQDSRDFLFTAEQEVWSITAPFLWCGSRRFEIAYMLSAK